jgi:hypothetical protein
MDSLNVSVTSDGTTGTTDPCCGEVLSRAACALAGIAGPNRVDRAPRSTAARRAADLPNWTRGGVIKHMLLDLASGKLGHPMPEIVGGERETAVRE